MWWEQVQVLYELRFYALWPGANVFRSMLKHSGVGLGFFIMEGFGLDETSEFKLHPPATFPRTGILFVGIFYLALAV